jgi:hypothetical protein
MHSSLNIRTFFGLAFVVGMLLPADADAQRAPDPNHGDHRWTQWGIMDGNRVRTLFSNHAEVGRWPDQPSGEWPKGTGRSYVDGVPLVVSLRTRDGRGAVITPMSTNYREFINRDPVTKLPWGWAPLPGYSNPRQGSPARSDDPATWPADWPDRPIEWAGRWNGYFGRGITNSDLETYFVMDDAFHFKWTQDPYRFYPCQGDPTRGGLGLEVATRGFQWTHVLAQDVIFWHYEITNECDVSYDDVFYAQYIDWGIGGTDDSGDDEGAYNARLDLAFAWDYDGIGTPGQWGPVGVAGYAFLESPGNHTDGKDNDFDGIIDERRDSGPGTLIEGRENIRAFVEQHYNLADFELFYGPLERRPAYISGRWWTGDENLNWVGFTDLNENGVWDPGEPSNDDCGRDGLCPGDEGYPGADEGENDGIPTPGERNFDALDKDESDQIGLTGFEIFDVHRYQLIDDEENFRVFSRALPPLDDILLEGGRNLGMFFSSGPFPLLAGRTERFSMALLFADHDFNDPRQIENSSIARKKETVQQIYNANYQFARPPDKPTLSAIPGDGIVTLLWDRVSEDSFDPFLREFDFEGYMIYRSTEPNFNENLVITDSYGSQTYQRPIAQFDLKNGIRGLHPVDVNGVRFNLGNDSGLRHSYVDRNVINGQTYYYALVAYDRGFINRDESGNILTDPDGTVRGIAPSLTTSIIKADIGGRITTDINTAVVTPRPPGAGYVAPGLHEMVFTGAGTASMGVNIVVPGAVVEPGRFAIDFHNASLWQTDPSAAYIISHLDRGDVVAEGTLATGMNEIQVLEEGFMVEINNPEAVVVEPASVRFSDDETTYTAVVRPANVSSVVGSRFVPLPANFEIRFTQEVSDTSRSLALGMRRFPTRFYIHNLTSGTRQPFIIVEDVDSLRNSVYDHGDLIIIVSGDAPGNEPTLQGGRWTGNWAVRIYPPDPDIHAGVPDVPPSAGTHLRFETRKPFRTGDAATFALTPAGFDTDHARTSLNDVYVVPNPYVATSIFEPANVYRAGRGERRIYFRNLPPQCTVRIYTLSGQLVQTLSHDSTPDDGQMSWNLVSRDGMDIAFGVYIYHVDAPGVGQAVGRFAIIK